MNDATYEFAERAREFVSWAEMGSPKAPELDAFDVLDILVRLCAAALTLPYGQAADPRDGTTETEWRQVFARCSNLPLDYYWEMSEPLATEPGEPVCGSVSDDLADIHRDLKAGLSYFDDGEHEAAAWIWQFNFRAHWGRHASGAIYALHTWFADSNWPDARG